MSAPLHERIRAEMEGRILSGALAPGDRLPTEKELCEAHGCARMTVNRALSMLATAGLIERRKKAGSFVARPRVHAMVLDIPDLASEVTKRGDRYRFALTGRRVRKARMGELDGAPRVLELEGLHFANDRPLAHEWRIVSLAAVPGIVSVDLSTLAPGTWLLDHVPWTEAETGIRATLADAAMARALDLVSGAACLVIKRRTWRGAAPITFVRQHFDAECYDLSARFSSRAV